VSVSSGDVEGKKQVAHKKKNFQGCEGYLLARKVYLQEKGLMKGQLIDNFKKVGEGYTAIRSSDTT